MVIVLLSFVLQCELHESKTFSKVDDELELLIRQRNPKLQAERRSSILSQQEDGKLLVDIRFILHSCFRFSFLIEANRLAALRLYRGVRHSSGRDKRRKLNTIVELSPEQARISPENLDLTRESTDAPISSVRQSMPITLICNEY
jgi:hypothetical protein